MAEFNHADLRGSRFERVDLSGAQLRAVDLSGARFRGVDLSGAVMRGVELVDVNIDGEIAGLTINASTSGPWSRPNSTAAIATGPRCGRQT